MHRPARLFWDSNVPLLQPKCLDDEAKTALLSLANRCHARGWALATSGNFSARIDGESFAITATGRCKGTLAEVDLLTVDLAGNPLSVGRPSAETPLHAQIYRRRPDAGAVAHTHSMPATVLSRALAAEGALVLTGYEMAKALAGVTSHEATIRLPIFPNDQDVHRLAAKIDDSIGDDDRVHGYLLEGHGLYTWGRDIAEASRHLEAIEFLLQCVLHARR
ncbi:methylthioribulose 1-phosphate dehydratase [Polyangium aurulentum]|nr:methylthioribulose 1-phosphate dehydratase [Polyangium aurulentum]